jgi:hypothetical protein
MDPHANSPSIKIPRSICHFQKLPQELILEILKGVRSAALVPLILSAKFFNNTWNEHYTTICPSLLRREATFAAAEALELLTTQTGIPGYAVFRSHCLRYSLLTRKQDMSHVHRLRSFYRITSKPKPSSSSSTETYVQPIRSLI